MKKPAPSMKAAIVWHERAEVARLCDVRRGQTVVELKRNKRDGGQIRCEAVLTILPPSANATRPRRRGNRGLRRRSEGDA
jgi:hypothetical protein